MNLTELQLKTLTEITEKYRVHFTISVDKDGRSCHCSVFASDNQSIFYRTGKNSGLTMPSTQAETSDGAIVKMLDELSKIKYFTWNKYPESSSFRDDDF